MSGNKKNGRQTERVVDGVELGIREGTFAPGTPIPSYRSLSDLYDVSINTVRRAIDILVGKGLLYRKERSGTYVRAELSTENSSDSNGLNCVTVIEKPQPLSRAGFQQAYMAGYTEAMEHLDIKMRFEVWQKNLDDFGVLIADRFSAKDQGCVLVNFVDRDFMQWLDRMDLPFVVQYYCYYPTEELPPHDRVYVNKMKAGFEATQHLLDIGHRRIGFAGHSRASDNLPGLYDGYRAALLRAGTGPRSGDIMEFSTDEVSAALSPVRKFLGRNNLPTAVFCKTDALAIAFLKVAPEVGIHVPDDLSVVGFNDLPAAAKSDPPLTTIASPRRFLGKTAVELLFSSASEDRDGPQERVLGCHLLLRESTAPADKAASGVIL
ncbi:MAG: GntR family transcriptional regulator [Candidatus Brocadiia bacterium]